MSEQTLDGAPQVDPDGSGNEETIDHYGNLKSSLPEDLQGHVTHESFGDFVKDYADVKGKVPVVPENADGYQLEFSEEAKPYIDDGLMADFRKGAFEAGMTQAHIDFVKSFEEKRIAAGMESFTEMQGKIQQAGEQEKQLDNALTELKQRWGDKYDENHDKANQVFGMFLDEKGIKAEDLPASVTGNPHVVEMLSVIGSKLSEDTFVSGGQVIKEKTDKTGSPLMFDPKVLEGNEKVLNERK